MIFALLMLAQNVDPATIPGVPPAIQGWAQIGGYVVAITTAILTARHIAEKAQGKADDALKAAANSEHVAKLAHERVDDEEERRAQLDKDLAVTRNDLKHAQEEIAILRKVRHDVIDTLNGVVQFLANVKEHREEADNLRSRIKELERGSQ